MKRNCVKQVAVIGALTMALFGLQGAWAQYDLLNDMTISYFAFGNTPQDVEETDQNGPLHTGDPNGMIDATEIKMLEIILNDPAFNVNGLTNALVLNAFTTNVNGITLYMNGLNSVVEPDPIPAGLIPLLANFLGAYITMGTDGHFYVNGLLALLGPVPPLGSFGDTYDMALGDSKLAPGADADGDGTTNLAEYQRIVSLNPALDPAGAGEPQLGDAALRGQVYAGAALNPDVKDYDLVADLVFVLGALGLPPGTEELWDSNGGGAYVPNGIVDAAEFILIEAIIENPALGLAKIATHAAGIAAWTQNLVAATTYGQGLVAGGGNPMYASSMFINFVTAYSFLGTPSQASLNSLIASVGGPPLGSFGETYNLAFGDTELLPASDPDGDGATLQQEYARATGANIREVGASFAVLALDGTTDVVAPTVTSITLDTPSPTTGGDVVFTVTFSEDVVNFESADDLVVTKDAEVTLDTVVVGAVKAPDAYTVTLTGVSGNGELSIAVAVAAPGDVQDLAGNPFAGDGSNASPVVVVSNPAEGEGAPECVECVPTGPGVYRAGQDVCLEVPAPVSATSTYLWTKDGMSLGGRVARDDCRDLQLFNVQAGDSGKYECFYDDGAKAAAVYTAVIQVGEGLPVGGLLALSMLVSAIGGLGVVMQRRKK
jgi:hypothetical protein